MKTTYKILTFAATAAMLLNSCRGTKIEMPSTEGELSFASFALSTDDELIMSTKATEPADGSYAILIYDQDDKLAVSTTYAQVKATQNSIKLTAGHYTLVARSTVDDVPASAFEKPVYGTSTSFDIAAGKTTEIGTLTCALRQCKVTVAYDDAFMSSVTGDGAATVEVTAGAPLSYAMTYAGGKASYDKRAGFFAVNNGSNTTMTVTFKGMIDGQSKKMTAVFNNIAERQWRQIKFVKKVDEQGNATFELIIEGYVDDEELRVNLNVQNEEILGPDPEAPIGDGGITLTLAEGCTMFDDLSNIVVPEMSTPMDLRLVATIPDGIKKFVVHIASTNDAFLKSVETAGGADLDLISPSPESEIIFQIVPFPHGNDLLGKTTVAFDLSGAQEAILAFPGTHTFTMSITDRNGCKKQIDVNMIVR